MQNVNAITTKFVIYIYIYILEGGCILDYYHENSLNSRNLQEVDDY